MQCSAMYAFFCNDTAATEIYTLSLHDALPIWRPRNLPQGVRRAAYLRHRGCGVALPRLGADLGRRSLGRARRWAEGTSELHSPQHLVCRLLLGKNRWRLRSAACGTVQSIAAHR